MASVYSSTPLHSAEFCNEAVYYSKIFVRSDSSIQTFSDLQGCTFAFNDKASLSGYYCMIFFVLAYSKQNSDIKLPFFGHTVRTGGHIYSLDAVLEGRADVAAIDVNVLARLEHDVKGKSQLCGLRALDVPTLNNLRFGCAVSSNSLLGPHPAQPIVVSRRLSACVMQQLQQCLCNLTSDMLEPMLISRYIPVNEEHYADIANMIDECEGNNIIA